VILAAALLLSPVTAAAQVKPCDELRQEIDARLQEKGVRDYRLTVAPADQQTPLTVVGRCEGGAKQILYERLGVTDRQPEPGPDPAGAEPEPAGEPPSPPPTEPARGVEPAQDPEPAAPPPATETAAPAPASPGLPPPSPPAPTGRAPATLAGEPTAVIVLGAIDGTSGVRIPRGDLARVQALSVAAGTASADASREQFVQRTRMGLLPDLRGGGREPGEFILVETDQNVGSQKSSLILHDGHAILAEGVSVVMGLMPDRHDGLHDLCVAIRDLPTQAYLYSYWVFEFTGDRYARRARAFGTNTCDEKVMTPIVRR
jgi:hypothetical protein